MLCTVRFHQYKTCECFVFVSNYETFDEAQAASVCPFKPEVVGNLSKIPTIYVWAQFLSLNGGRSVQVLGADFASGDVCSFPVLAINGIFATKCGFAEYDEVYVQAVGSFIPKCLTVEVQPLSSDDWEIVSLNASKIEEQLLDQLQIVQRELVFPMWIDRRLCVFLRVERLSPDLSFCHLENGCEVSVCPVLTRPNATLSSGIHGDTCPNLSVSGLSPNVQSESRAADESVSDSEVTTKEPAELGAEENQSLDDMEFECFDDLIGDCVRYCEIALCLDTQPPTSSSMDFGHLLIHGPQDSGVSWTAKKICGELYRKHFVFYKRVDCRTLRGKKVENVEKRLNSLLAECSCSGPSVLILDELDQLCNAGSSLEQINPGGHIAYTRLARTVMNCVEKCRRESNQKLLVLGSGRSRQSFHHTLVSSRGKRFFTEIKTLPDLTPDNRLRILGSIGNNIASAEIEEFSRKTDGFLVGDFKRLSERAHLARIQRISGETFAHKPVSCSSISVEDLEVAFKDYIPLNLHNVTVDKSDRAKLGWDDVGGMGKVKKVLVQTFLWPAKYPHIYQSCHLRLARGVLLYGPSGTGKTLIARVVANECTLNFISVKGPELLSKYIGASEQGVRDTFTRARRAKPCLIFFDEFDALAPRRGHDSTGVTDRVVNQLLTEMDGVESLEGVFILAASSRPDLLDPALLRPGRMDRYLFCGFPGLDDRRDILVALSKTLELSEDVKLGEIALRTEGFTGADLKSLLVTAQIKAAQNLQPNSSRFTVSHEDLLYALDNTKPSTKRTERNRAMQLVPGELGSSDPVPVGQRITLA